ncbi:hypothetical protein MRX96_004854 [Rhipicephalus microplus]
MAVSFDGKKNRAVTLILDMVVWKWRSREDIHMPVLVSWVDFSVPAFRKHVETAQSELTEGSVSSTSIDARTCQESVAAAVAVDTVAATASEESDDATARRCRRLRRHRIHERDEPAVASHAIPAPQVPPARGGRVV